MLCEYSTPCESPVQPPRPRVAAPGATHLTLAALPLAATLIAGGLLSLLVAGCARKPAAGGGAPQYPPPDVTTATVQQKDVPVYGSWAANLDGYTNAQIQPQVSGYLVRQDYKEGSVVRKGQVLFEIDPRPFQAVLDQAQGQLAQAKAQLDLAQINVKRDTPLAQARAIARAQLDTDLQTEAGSQANVQAAEAAVETARLNLGFTRVRSLLDGLAGIATTQVGSLVSQSTVLTTVSQVQPIKVYFGISEQEYLELSGRARSGGAADLLHASGRVPIELTLADGSVYPSRGSIVFVDRSVDQSTGTIRVAAAFPNPQNLLRPGQYGTVRAQTAMNRGALLVPQRAVTELQGSFQVAVVSAGNTVHIENVQVGPQVGTDWVITAGLRPGQRVVTEGVGKLAEGMPVHPHPGAETPGAADGGQPGSGGGR